jgi:hypothetical protein
MLVVGVEPMTNLFKLGIAESCTRYRSLESLGIEPATDLIKLEVAGN